jgi:hypothetical protein
MRTLLVVLAVALFAAPPSARAAAPAEFAVQGVLRDNLGKLATMPIMVGVSLYPTQTGGVAFATYGPFANVPATNGLFSVSIPAPGLAALLTGQAAVYIEISANGSIFPRQLVTSEMFALSALQADGLSAACSGCVTDAMVSQLSASKVMGKVASCGAADNAASLGGVAAASYLTTAAANAAYLGVSAQAADSAKLGGALASSYLTIAAANAAYLGVTAQAADSAKLGGALASSYQHVLLTPDCGVGKYIQKIATDGTVTCGTDNPGTVTSVTAAAPLAVTLGTTTPAITIGNITAASVLPSGGIVSARDQMKDVDFIASVPANSAGTDQLFLGSYCAGNDIPITGGCFGDNGAVSLYYSAPAITGGFETWHCGWRINDNAAHSLKVRVSCYPHP